MGIENRDYYRNSSKSTHRPSSFADMPIVCKRLLIGTIAVFLLQMFITRPATISDLGEQFHLYGLDSDDFAGEMPEGYTKEDYAAEILRVMPQVSVVQDWLQLDPEEVQRGQVWRVVTYIFCHDRHGVWHLIINMLFLYWFGTRLEQMYGSTEFCLFYFASAITAGIAFLGLDYYTGNPTSAIGASGAVWGLIALYVVHHPYERINVYGMFPIEIRWLALLYLVLDLHPVLLAISGEGMVLGGGVAHAAHLGGAAFGFLYYYRSLRLTPILNRVTGNAKHAKWKSRTVPPTKRDVIPMSRPDFPNEERIDPRRKRLEAELDHVLEKIQNQGRESLTDDEVRILEEASRQLRDRP